MTILWIIITFLSIAIIAIIANAIEDYNSTLKFPIQSTLEAIGVPIITLYNNRKELNFLIDSGANLSLIDSNIIKEIKYKKLHSSGTMYGIGGNVVEVQHIHMKLYIENSVFKEDFQVTDLAPSFGKINETHGVKIHGILGNSFFSKYNGIIDYSKYIFYIDK